MTRGSPFAVPKMVALDPRTDPRWRELATRPGGSVFTSPPWIAAVCDGYGFTPDARVLIGSDGRPTDGLVWVHVADARGERLSSLRFSDRAEPLVADAEAWGLLAAEPLAAGLPFTVRCLDDSPAVGDPRLTTVGEAAWHGLPLAGSADELLARASPETRRNLRTADRAGLRVVAGDELESLRAFHRLHVTLRKRKYRMLAQPLDFFECIWEQFAPDDSLLTVLAMAGDEPVAGALYLVWGDVAYYKFGASIPERLSLRPNEAVHGAAIRWAMERGLTLLDWGLSDFDQPGLLRYKRKWGSAERRIVTLRGGPAPGALGAEVGALLAEVTRLLTDDAVPDEVAARAGAALYRYFC